MSATTEHLDALASDNASARAHSEAILSAFGDDASGWIYCGIDDCRDQWWGCSDYSAYWGEGDGPNIETGSNIFSDAIHRGFIRTHGGLTLVLVWMNGDRDPTIMIFDDDRKLAPEVMRELSEAW